MVRRVVLLTLGLLTLLLTAASPTLSPGAVVGLAGTPHLWIADAQGVLHWGGDTRALAGKHVNWSDRRDVSLTELQTLPIGDPWLSAGLLKDGDPIYLVKWESHWPQPKLLHIQSIKDVEVFGIDATNYGNYVLDKAVWEQRYGLAAADLERGALASAVPPGVILTLNRVTTGAAPVAVGTSAPITVTGTGQDVRSITLGDGIYIISVEAVSSQSGHFSVHFLDSTGEPSGDGLIVNEVLDPGTFRGRGTLTVGTDGLFKNKPGQQLIEVSADSTTRWSVVIASAASAASVGTTVPITVSGIGQDVQSITLGDGTYIISVEAVSSQSGHFSVHFLDSTGEPSGDGLIVNEVLDPGTFRGRGTLTVGTDGLFKNKPGQQLIEVSADSTTRWSILIASP